MSKRILSLGLLVFVLTGCGGGSPYTGYWLCDSDADRSLEIRRFEDYFAIISRSPDGEYRRDGAFEDEVFTAGANNVGAKMALELNEDTLSCTKPPNFCKCSSGYARVEALPEAHTRLAQKPAEATAEDSREELNPLEMEQLLVNREPLVVELNYGGTLRIFDDARNIANEKRRYDWPLLTYYYLPELTLVRHESGALAEVKIDGDTASIALRVKALPVDKFELMDIVHETFNTKIQERHVLPMGFEQLTIGTADLEGVMAAEILSTDALLNGKPFEVLIPLASGIGEDQITKIVTTIISATDKLTASISVDEIVETPDFTEAAPVMVTKAWPVVVPFGDN
ncbi:MAG: hypothetical protein AAF384_06700 [Pseudomonadota bacterium]